MHPSQARAAASRVDDVLRGVLEKVCGFTIPQEEEGLPYTCPVGALDGASFQATLTSLPIKSGGLGMRSQEEQCEAAWIGALEQAIPSMGGERSMCPHLSHLAGEEEGVMSR